MTGQLVGMLLAGIGALVLVRLARRGLPWAKPAAAGLAVVTLVLAGPVTRRRRGRRQRRISGGRLTATAGKVTRFRCVPA